MKPEIQLVISSLTSINEEIKDLKLLKLDST